MDTEESERSVYSSIQMNVLPVNLISHGLEFRDVVNPSMIDRVIDMNFSMSKSSLDPTGSNEIFKTDERKFSRVFDDQVVVESVSR